MNCFHVCTAQVNVPWPHWMDVQDKCGCRSALDVMF